jgi:hypothetical protein
MRGMVERIISMGHSPTSCRLEFALMMRRQLNLMKLTKKKKLSLMRRKLSKRKKFVLMTKKQTTDEEIEIDDSSVASATEASSPPTPTSQGESNVATATGVSGVVSRFWTGKPSENPNNPEEKVKYEKLVLKIPLGEIGDDIKSFFNGERKVNDELNF